MHKAERIAPRVAMLTSRSSILTSLSPTATPSTVGRSSFNATPATRYPFARRAFQELCQLDSDQCHQPPSRARSRLSFSENRSLSENSSAHCPRSIRSQAQVFFSNTNQRNRHAQCTQCEPTVAAHGARADQSETAQAPSSFVKRAMRESFKSRFAH